MKTKTFEIPVEAISDLVEKLKQHNIHCEVTGVAEDGDLIARIDYEPDLQKAVDALQAVIYLLKYVRAVEKLQQDEKQNAA